MAKPEQSAEEWIKKQIKAHLSESDGVHAPPSRQALFSCQEEKFFYYAMYPYEEWRPAQQRVDFVTRFARGECLLDIACGAYPVSADVNCAEKIGLDISLQAACKAKHYFTQFYLLDLEETSDDYLARLGTFDTIVASEFLEHTTDPAAVLYKIAPLCRKDGRFLVTVPNGQSIANKMDLILHGNQYKRFKTFHSSHVSLLPKQKWEELFAQAGFSILQSDFRPSDIIPGFPQEHWPFWKLLCSKAPQYLAHQFFYVLTRQY